MASSAVMVPFDAVRRSTDWQRWGALAASAPPYLAPELFALARPLAAAVAPDWFVAEAWDGGGLIGALPLGRRGHELRALRGDHSPAFDYCGAPAGLDAIWALLRADRGWAELVVDRVPADGVLATRLPALARAAGHPVTVRPDAEHVVLALPGFAAALSPKLRANLQRCARHAGALELERIAVPTRADLEAAAAIEGLGWKGAAGTAIAQDARVGHLYQALGRVLGRRGRAALYFLRRGDRRIATLFALEDADTLYALKIGHDPEFARLGPGHLMIWFVAAAAERRGLRALDFVGHTDEWKRRWSTAARAHVAIVVYQRTARGLARYALREQIKPRLPAALRASPRSPLPRRCQRRDVVGEHAPLAALVGRARRWLGPTHGRVPARREPRGVASRFPVGSWVRVLEPGRLRALLAPDGRGRGLALTSVQWDTCGQVYQVAGHVRRTRDEDGRDRPVSATVILAGVHCDGDGATPRGCGRRCPLLYRDEWLEAAPAPRRLPPTATAGPHARVRSAEEIAATLDAFGRRDGVTFMPHMAAFAGQRFAIAATPTRVRELGEWATPRAPLYVLAGPRCDGAIAGARAPCDRACPLVWHADWLILEPS